MKQALIDCFKDPGVTAVLRDEVLMPVVEKAVSDRDAVVAKDSEIRQLKMELAKQRRDINDLESILQVIDVPILQEELPLNHRLT